MQQPTVTLRIAPQRPFLNVIDLNVLRRKIKMFVYCVALKVYSKCD